MLRQACANPLQKMNIAPSGRSGIGIGESWLGGKAEHDPMIATHSSDRTQTGSNQKRRFSE